VLEAGAFLRGFWGVLHRGWCDFVTFEWFRFLPGKRRMRMTKAVVC
jgi:hypothetical protein